MTQDNIQQDTPQDAASNQEFTSLEESIFGSDTSTEGSNNISDIFTTGDEGNTEQASDKGQPQVSESGNTQVTEENAIDNDTKRYQYWQSQADRYKNELEEARKTSEAQVAPVTPQPVQEVPQKQVEEFPAPPERPKRPRVFSREEAYTDSSSESARYLDSKEDWDEQMAEYNALRTQYQTAVIQERFDNFEQEKVEVAKRHEAAQIAQNQKSEIISYVTGHHGMSQDEANNFMSTMSDPSSISIDNLVQLYRMKSGGAPTQGNPPAPSQNFTQTKNAQQVPSSMGVMPSGQSNTDGRTFEDKIMDNLIGDFNSKNPWK